MSRRKTITALYALLIFASHSALAVLSHANTSDVERTERVAKMGKRNYTTGQYHSAGVQEKSMLRGLQSDMSVLAGFMDKMFLRGIQTDSSLMANRKDGPSVNTDRRRKTVSASVSDGLGRNANTRCEEAASAL